MIDRVAAPSHELKTLKARALLRAYILCRKSVNTVSIASSKYILCVRHLITASNSVICGRPKSMSTILGVFATFKSMVLETPLQTRSRVSRITPAVSVLSPPTPINSDFSLDSHIASEGTEASWIKPVVENVSQPQFHCLPSPENATDPRNRRMRSLKLVEFHLSASSQGQHSSPDSVKHAACSCHHCSNGVTFLAQST